MTLGGQKGGFLLCDVSLLAVSSNVLVKPVILGKGILSDVFDISKELVEFFRVEFFDGLEAKSDELLLVEDEVLDFDPDENVPECDLELLPDADVLAVKFVQLAYSFGVQLIEQKLQVHRKLFFPDVELLHPQRGFFKTGRVQLPIAAFLQVAYLGEGHFGGCFSLFG
jgi:hypothetical protein